MLKNKITIDDIINLLNDALKLDPDAMTNLIRKRVVCNKELAKHPTIQVGVIDDNYQVGLLGILNGLFGVDEKGIGAIASHYTIGCPNGCSVNGNNIKYSTCDICDSDLIFTNIIEFFKNKIIKEVNMSNNVKLPLVVNLFGGAGASKSTNTAYIFSELKRTNINCEMALEYAKELSWIKDMETLNDQIYVFAEQRKRVRRLLKYVDIIVTDSPILLSTIYKPDDLSRTFDNLVLEEFNKFNNLNYFIVRDDERGYNPKGRNQDVEGAKEKDNEILNLLTMYNISFKYINGTKEGGDIIVKEVKDNFTQLLIHQRNTTPLSNNSMYQIPKTNK